MVKRSLRQSYMLLCCAMVAGFFLAAPSSLSAARRPRRADCVHVDLQDTGKTVALSVGEDLIVRLPLWRYDDDYWFVTRNTGLKLVAGPDTRRPPNWTPFMHRSQVFYFRRESPGTAHLVLDHAYWSKPMVLKVVDR